MAAEEEWYFEEEGCLQFSGRPTSVTFSPSSNCFICTLEDGSIEVVDVRSGLRLKRTTPAGCSGPLQCRFCQEVDKLFITNGTASGLRKDLNGVLLLESILQPQIRVSDQAQLVLELSLPDALQLLSALEICMPTEEVILKPMQMLHSQLKVEVEKAKLLINSTHDKAAKWYTCQLKELNTTFRVALNRLVGKLQKNNTALPAVAAMLARIINATGKVDGKKATTVAKIDMSIEALRRNTFLSWPHKEYRWAYPEAMAKAGFYHQPSSSGDDRALCFTCNVCLVCWEPTDEPWSEHERHSPDCPFVRGDYTENVPISVSLATGPALDHEAVQIKLISESSCSLYLATCSEEGHVIIWDIQEQLKIHSQFQVKFPVDVVTTSGECTQSSVSEAPASFVAWAGPEDDEGISGVETTDAHINNDPTQKADENTDKADVLHEKCQENQGDHTYKGNDSFSTTEKQASQDSVKVTALAIVCSCGKEATYTTDRKVRADHHTATLVLAVSIAQDSVGTSVDGQSGPTKLGPYILVYDILCDAHNKSNGVLNEQNFGVVGGFEIDKELLLQDPFSTSGSEDDWGYEPMALAPPHSLHSSVLQKFAEAITGEDSDTKEKLNKSEKESIDPGKVVQCMQLLNIINAQCCKVAQIVPFGNGESVLLNIHFCESCRHKKKSPIKSKCHTDEVSGNSTSAQAKSSSAQGNDQNVPNSSEHNYKDCIIVVYRIITSNEQRTLSQQPARIKQYFTLEGLVSSIVVLPVESFELFTDVSSAPPEEGNVGLSCPSQFFVAAAKHSVVIIDADSLNVLAKFTASNESSNQAQFTHVLNCPGVDCLCACTEDGNMHFLALRHQLADKEQVDGLVQNTTDSSVEKPAAGPCIQTDCLLDPKEPVTVKCLQSLMRLTEYVTLVPRFTASVPSSWVEMQEDQQHLNQQTLMQPVLHSRTWKLCSDNNSVQVKEQVVELLLPKYCQLGHIDVRFTLKSVKFQPSTNVYLLNSSCPISFKPGSRNAAHCPPKNRILATAREQDSIICGPVSLKLGLDSTGRQGRITLTSPELIKTSSRVLLIVFESCGSREDLAEVSVTVARFKNNSPVEWRLPRSSLLDDSGLHKRLLDICVGSELVEGVTRASEGRKLALELLCWIGATSVNSNVGKNCLFNEVEAYLPWLIRSCYLQYGRSIAHRCSRLLMICGRRVIGDKTQLGGESSFRRTLLDAILDALPDTPCAVSSGAVHWLFKLLTGFAAEADPTSASSQCLKLLELFSSRLTATRFPEHLVLQARYGLYGCPFDPVLFDVRPKTSPAQQSSPNGVTSPLLQTSRIPSSISSDREVWSSVDSSMACQGLLEVQPLHFVCCSTSDGARVERGDAVQPPGTARVQMAGSVVPGGVTGPMPPSWPSSSSLAVLEKELQLLKMQQHQHQLVSLQQTKKQLQQQKKDLEDLSMWSLFPKLLSKVEVVNSGGLLLSHPSPLPPSGSFSFPSSGPGGSTLINLAQQKKLSSSPRKQERPATTSLSQPLEQHLMQLPPPQVLVIDRLHAGARHHVLLDFGCVVQLTDVLIPQCPDITSLSVDVFTHWEDLDVERIAVVSDINLCAFVLKDLLPPPLCRYVKLTVVGRPKNNAKARVKIGEFYGHPLCGQSAVSGVMQVSDVSGYDHHCLPILRNLLEDIYCHYNLSCTQLRTLLQSCGPRNTRADLATKGAAMTEEEKKILRAYKECMSLQHQLNLVEQSINRSAHTLERRASVSCLDEAKHDHLQVICSCLVDTVVALMGVSPSSEGFLAKAKTTLEWQPWMKEVTRLMCDTLFRNICVHGSPQLRERVGALLLNSCGSKPWWGEFLASVLKEFFSSVQTLSFPQERMFVVLVSLSQCSPSIELVLTSFLRLLDEQLPIKDLKVDVPSVDLTLVGWLLLLLSHVLDTCIVQCKPFSSKTDPGDKSKASVNGIGVPSSSSKSKTYKPAKRGKTYKQSRWDFMLPMPVNQTAGSSSESTGYHPFSRHKMSKHSPSLSKKPASDPPSHQSLLKSHVKQQLSYKMKDLVRIQHSQPEEDKPGIEERTHQSVFLSPSICLPTGSTVPVMQKMMSFILNMNSNCSVDLFLVVCKVLAHLSFVSEHCVCLSDVATHEQVEQLLRMCVVPMHQGVGHWGGAWTVHSLTSLIQDLLQGEKRSAMGDTRKGSVQSTVPEPLENGRDSPDAMNMESKMVLMDAESGDSFDELYDVPPVDELPAPGWLVEFGETEFEFSSVVTPLQEKKATARASSVEAKVGPPPVKLSSAIDIRLELGIEMEAEQDLKMLEHLQADAIAKVLSFSSSPSRSSIEPLRKLPPRNGGSLRAEPTLQSAFHTIFNDCDSPGVDVASLLNLWLTVQHCSPGLKLDVYSVNKLLLHLVRQPDLSSQCQQLGFQVLTAVCEGQLKSSTQAEIEEFVNSKDLLCFLVKSLSLPSAELCIHSPSTKPVKGFLFSLQSAVNGCNSAELASVFQDMLLKTLLELSSNRLANRAVTPQVKPITNVLQECGNELWCNGNLDVKVKLVDVSVQLSLEHLIHRPSVSLLPSAPPPPPLTPGVTQDKLDDSDWLVKLLFVVIQIVQGSETREPKNKRHQPPSSGSSVGSFEQGSRQVQEEVETSDGLMPGNKRSASGLADLLVQRKETFLRMLQCLNLCSADNAIVLLLATSLLQDHNSPSEIQGNEKPTSVEDGIVRLLHVIHSQVTGCGVLVDGILAYLKRTSRHDLEPIPAPQKQLSDPLLWLLLKVLDSSETIAQFYEKGGLALVCQSIASGQSFTLDHTPSGLIPVMQELASNKREMSKAAANITEADWTKATINYAPYGTISCSSSPKHPPDALLKATAPHRRARSATWSYRCTPDESWCELMVSLPTAILLSDVHIQPHSAGLATCPSHVALDISNDKKVVVPVCGPVLTTGISLIKLKLQHPQIAQHIHIRCHRPRDSRVLGLSQIKIYGTSLFGSQNMVNQLLLKSEPQGTSLGWVRLLSHCLTEGPDLTGTVNTPTLWSDVFSTCTTLLLSPQSGMFSWCIETVLMKLSIQFPELGTLLIKQLLQGTSDEERARGRVVSMTSVELIYQLGKHHDAVFLDRLAIMSSWLESVLSCDSLSPVVVRSGHIQAVASVIWVAKDYVEEITFREHFPETLFRALFKQSQSSSCNDDLKQSIDHLICALSHICPPYYDVLLELTGVKNILNHPGKKGTPTGSLSNFLSSAPQLATLASASQSPVTSQLLLDCGLLELLVESVGGGRFQLLFESQDQAFKAGSPHAMAHKGNGVSTSLLPQLLNFLTSCCQEPSIKDWMGGVGHQFLFPLLSVLSRSHNSDCTSLFSSSYERFSIETATVALLCKCVHCHPRNQQKMASLLCDVIEDQAASMRTDDQHSFMRISGFLRQLMLQMLLQEEKVLVCLHLEGDANWRIAKEGNSLYSSTWRPLFGAGHSFILLSLKCSSTLQELSEQILFPFVDKKILDSLPEDRNSKQTADVFTDPDDLYQYEGFEVLESVSLAAGLNVKSKRAEKTELTAAKEGKIPPSDNQNQGGNLSCFFYHRLLGDVPLPHSLMLSQLLKSLMTKGIPSGTSFIELTCRTKDDNRQGDDTLLQLAPLLSPLDVFAKQNGLSRLSIHLPSHLIMPAAVTSSGSEEGGTVVEDSGSRWPCYPTRLPLPLVSLPASVLSTVPAHSLVAFGLFIQLPGYDKILLQDPMRARYLLRLLLGAKQDSDGGSILSSPVATSLSTLPFQVLRMFFQNSALASDNGVIVQRAAIEVGAIQLVLLCLAVLSHHQPQTVSHTHKLALQALSALTGSVYRDGEIGSASERNYWAKGTGFGTGSTSSGWDVEQAMLKQRAEEEHVTCLLQVLASYIGPFGSKSDSTGEPLTTMYRPSTPPSPSDSLPASLLDLLHQSCLVPTLSSYLRNDSVLDMARHVPLYQAVLEVLRAIASCPVLLPLLLPEGDSHSQQGTLATEPPSIAGLLEKMKQCVDTYSRTLRSTQGKTEDTALQNAAGEPSSSGQGSQGQGTVEERKDPEAEGLALLIPDIQQTAKLMHKVVEEFHQQQASCRSDGTVETAGNKTAAAEAAVMSHEERYLATIRPLQFGTHKIVIENKDGKLEFDSGGYHFSSSLRSAAASGGNGGSGGMVRARRLAQEVSSLATSLPLSSSSSVFVRCDKERLDVMKVLITGPSDTPYANGCFEFDVYFPQNYPESPMYINFETTGHHSIRFNPNLYNDGKVCLSILNTWHGRPEEKWNPQNSSFLQVLVSIQSLILVHEPYFNEPGYERSRGTPAGQQNSREYDANICQATVRWAMLEQLRKPSPCFKEVIQAHFYLKKEEIIEQCEKWIKDTEGLLSARPVGRAISHHVQSLKQNTALLKQELARLTPPPEHRESDSDEDSD